jgi:hypothetical protein
MKRMLFVSVLALMVSATIAQAQEGLSTTRIQVQHKLSDSMRTGVAKHEENLLRNLESGNPTVQAQAVQTIRDLEQIFPDYPFKASLAPLGAKLKDEHADGVVRRLAALALDELHSEAGDALIGEVAFYSQDEGLQTLCKALMVRSQFKKVP